MKDMVVTDKHYLATIVLMMTSVSKGKRLPEGNRISRVYNEICFYNLKVTHIFSQLKEIIAASDDRIFHCADGLDNYIFLLG